MRIITAAAALLATSPVAISAVLAADIETATRIDAVTVYPDGATVTRLAEIAVPQGANTLLIRGLPAALDPASVRVEAVADGDLAIDSVETRLAPGDAKPAVDADLEAKIAALVEEGERVAARLDALEVKRKSIVRFSDADPTKVAGGNNGIDPATWKAAWEAVGDELARVNEQMRVERARKSDLAVQITALEKARPAALQPGAPKHDVAISLEAGMALKGSLALAYRVGQAAWVPRYDAKLDTGKDRKSALELIRRAEIVQRTGEDWNDAMLTVSTTRVRGGTAAPVLTPLIVSFNDIAPYAVSGAAKPSLDELQRGKGAPVPAPAAPPVDAPWSSAQLTGAYHKAAVLDAGPYQASFKVPGRVNVPRDGSLKTFALSSTTLAPDLTVRIAPALDQTAYLDISFASTEEAPLLPGEVTIIRDGVFVGKGRLPLVAPGDKATLGFGADDRVRVTRVPLRQKDTEPSWIGTTRSQVTEFKTSVKNLHDAPIHVGISDRLPVSDVNLITVEPLPTNTPATEKVIDDKRGVLGWSFDLGANEQKDVRFGWRMKWPADRDILMHVEAK
jgi:uncharacterized protein (TIGR02231 family)